MGRPVVTKIKRYLRGSQVDRGITVDGPGLDNKSVVSLGAGIALALDLADRARKTFTVREYGDVIVHAVPSESGTGSHLEAPA